MTLYSKAHQLNDEQYASEMDREQAIGLLRFEVKCQTSQLKKILGTKQTAILSYHPQLLKTFLDNAPAILKTTICDLFPAGDYYHLPEAQRIIREQVPSPRNAERLCAWVSLASERQSAYLAKTEGLRAAIRLPKRHINSFTAAIRRQSSYPWQETDAFPFARYKGDIRRGLN